MSAASVYFMHHLRGRKNVPNRVVIDISSALFVNVTVVRIYFVLLCDDTRAHKKGCWQFYMSSVVRVVNAFSSSGADPTYPFLKTDAVELHV